MIGTDLARLPANAVWTQAGITLVTEKWRGVDKIVSIGVTRADFSVGCVQNFDAGLSGSRIDDAFDARAAAVCRRGSVVIAVRQACDSAVRVA